MRGALVPVALLALLSLLSCQHKQAVPAPSALVADAKAGFVVLTTTLWNLSQGTLTAKETIPLGEKLVFLGPTASAFQSGKQRDFLQARRESGSEGWVRADYVISKSILAVVTTDDAIIYTAADDTAATSATIPRMTVLAIHADTGGMRFIRVTAFDTVEKVLLKGVYLRNEGVSSNIQDAEAAILLRMAADSTNLKQRQAFLSSAIKDNPDTVFKPELNAALAALTAPPPAQRQTEPAVGVMSAADDGVSVYDSPDQTSGKVVGTLKKGQNVEVLEKTTASDTVGDKSAPWYRIQDPAGWVFGAGLTP